MLLYNGGVMTRYHCGWVSTVCGVRAAGVSVGLFLTITTVLAFVVATCVLVVGLVAARRCVIKRLLWHLQAAITTGIYWRLILPLAFRHPTYARTFKTYYWPLQTNVWAQFRDIRGGLTQHNITFPSLSERNCKTIKHADNEYYP